MTIDPETTPLLAQVTAKGHHIGAADEKNFEFGLECILDRAWPAASTAGGKPPAKAATQGVRPAYAQQGTTPPASCKRPCSDVISVRLRADNCHKRFGFGDEARALSLPTRTM